jgi:hypothetical protein
LSVNLEEARFLEGFGRIVFVVPFGSNIVFVTFCSSEYPVILIRFMATVGCFSSWGRLSIVVDLGVETKREIELVGRLRAEEAVVDG